MEERHYLLKIRLMEIEPEIWRRFVVRGDITLDRLHDVIQIVMGWKDYHLHEFAIGKKRYTENPESKEEGLREDRYRLVNLIKRKGRTFRYIYDFGDFWDHEILIEDSDYHGPGIELPVRCLQGERACPPEDVGGAPGYFEFLAAVSDPSHGEHENFREWYAGFPWHDNVFDSEKFDLEKVEYELRKYLRWTRFRADYWFFRM